MQVPIKSPFKLEISKPKTHLVDLSGFVAKMGELDQAIKGVNDLKKQLKDNHDKAILEMQREHVKEIMRVKQLQSLTRGATGLSGKDGNSPDEDLIAEKVISKIRIPQDGKTPFVDENKIAEKVYKLVPKPELDHEAIAEKVIELVQTGKKKLSMKSLGDSETAMQSYLRRYGYKPYIHGGGSSSGSTTNFIENEVVAGSGTSFILANSPVAGSVKVYALGQRLVLTTDYTISGTTITTVSSWNAGEIVADYRK